MEEKRKNRQKVSERNIIVCSGLPTLTVNIAILIAHTQLTHNSLQNQKNICESSSSNTHQHTGQQCVA